MITTTRIDQTVKYTLSITATAEPAIDGLKIYYTIDGTEPTANSKVYTEPFTFAGGSATVKDIAIGDGYRNSDVATQQIT